MSPSNSHNWGATDTCAITMSVYHLEYDDTVLGQVCFACMPHCEIAQEALAKEGIPDSTRNYYANN